MELIIFTEQGGINVMTQTCEHSIKKQTSRTGQNYSENNKNGIFFLAQFRGKSRHRNLKIFFFLMILFNVS